jgi:acetyl esterase
MKFKQSVDLLADVNFKSFMDNLNEHEKAVSQLSLSEQRKINCQLMATYNKGCESVHRVVDLEILGIEKNKIPLRIYIPNEFTSLPIMVYFHGGGWVFGSIEESDAVCRRLSNHLGCIIASVEYRLAPEFPFPKPLEDCDTATKWIVENAHDFGGDNENVFVGGESAGGNLAAAVALMARDQKGPKLSAQLLIYPAISASIQDAIYDQCPDHYFLTKEDMKFFWNMYIQAPGADRDPYASLDCNLEFQNLPPALIITAEYDPLTYDIEKYAIQLQQANVRVIQEPFSGLIHGFLYIPLYSEVQKVEWSKKIGSSLHKLGVLKKSNKFAGKQDCFHDFYRF